MDDNRFDDSIKNKLSEYEDSGFEPSALAALHHQMGRVSTMPWYSQYRTEWLLGSGLLLSTIIILWSQWFYNTDLKSSLNEKIASLQSHQEEIDKLKNEISAMKNSPPDTIRIIEIRERPSQGYNSLLYRIKLLEAANNNSTNKDANFENDQPGELEYSFPLSTNTFSNSNSSNDFNEWRLTPRTTSKASARAVSSTLPSSGTSNNLDAKTIRKIEDHYQKGIGIRIGPTLEFSKGFYNRGRSDMSANYGALADFIVSPSLSIETGIKYDKRYYEIINRNDLVKTSLPAVDESIGTLHKAEIDSWMFEIPVMLKYRYPLTLKSHFLGGLGYSSLIYWKQIFEYDYAFSGGGDSYTLHSTYDTRQASFFSGSLNITLGISNQLKNKKILETSVFYQHGIGMKGAEKINANFLGVHGVYWFTIR